jgi:prepilin-type N-terminal cleavage/methylation domain-containing protein
MNARDRVGFTLLELSIVLVIIALVTGMAMQSGISVVETARLTSSQNKMKAIEDALMRYRTAIDRLPCPADLTITSGNVNYGVEAANPGTCTGGTPAADFSAAAANGETAAEGALPAVSLGLSPEFMYDGWGNQFRYAVDVGMTASNAFANWGLSYTCGPITVNDAFGNPRTTNSIYAVVSHGANGHGAYTRNGVTVNAGSVNTNELTNCHCNSSAVGTTYAPTYVQTQQTLDPSNSLDNFDDLVSYKERWQMRTDWDSLTSAGAAKNTSAPDLIISENYSYAPVPYFLTKSGSGTGATYNYSGYQLTSPYGDGSTVGGNSGESLTPDNNTYFYMGYSSCWQFTASGNNFTFVNSWGDPTMCPFQFSADGRYAVSVGIYGGGFRFFSKPCSGGAYSVAQTVGTGGAPAISPDGNWVAAFVGGPGLDMYQRSGNSLTLSGANTIAVTANNYAGGAFSPDSTHFADAGYGYGSGAVEIFKNVSGTWTALSGIPQPSYAPYMPGVAYSPDGKYLAMTAIQNYFTPPTAGQIIIGSEQEFDCLDACASLRA